MCKGNGVCLCMLIVWLFVDVKKCYCLVLVFWIFLFYVCGLCVWFDEMW